MRYQADEMKMIDERLLECILEEGRAESVAELIEGCPLEYEDYEVFAALGRVIEYGLVAYDPIEDTGRITERGERYLAGELDLRGELD
jgi:hypothetical protein